MPLSIHANTFRSFNTCEKLTFISASALAVSLFVIGALSVLAVKGVPIGSMAHVSLKGGLICIGVGLSLGLLIIVCQKKEGHPHTTLSEGPIQPTKSVICCASRFTHGAHDRRNPLWDTWENITLMGEGGFRKYPPLPDQWEALWGPSPVTPMTDKIRIRWLGHASFLIETCVNGKTLTILTDPNWSDTITLLGPIPLYYRSLPPGLSFDQMPKIDKVILTHTHADHFNRETLERFEKRDHPQFFCPLEAGKLLSGFTNVQECSWWDKFSFENGVEMHSLPSDHASQTSAFDCNEYLWGGFMISIPIDQDKSYTIYVTGDSACNINPAVTGFQKTQWAFDTCVFRDIAEKFPEPDLMLLPVDPVIGQEDKHWNVYQGIDLLRRKIRPKKMIPQHWGTWPFNTFGRDLLGPVRVLKEALKEEDESLLAKLHQLKVGECITLV